MSESRRKFSICIPAYNRAVHLPALLDSIYAQNFKDFEIVICEDQSRERPLISEIANRYAERYPKTLTYIENSENLGYDANVRNIIANAKGEYCFFMGNDDLMCSGALATVAAGISRHKNVGLVLKSYAWFDNTPDKINQVVRYFNEERVLQTGKEAISICFRRVGVLSGLILHRDAAEKAATSEFDGTLYYQMHITSEVLAEMNAVCLPDVLVLSRNSEAPEFGNSSREKGKYTPGVYTPEARLNMISGVIRIVTALDHRRNLDMKDEVMRDYANYFYPYIRDQLNLPIKKFYNLYRNFGKMGFSRYPMFHLYFIVCYLLGQNGFDKVTGIIRKKLGTSLQIGLRKSRVNR